MNPIDIINWTRAPPNKVLLMRVSKSNPDKTPITKTRIRYLPMTDQDIYKNLLEMLRSMRVTSNYQTAFDENLEDDGDEKQAIAWFNEICRKSQEMFGGTVDFWLFWGALEWGMELYYSGKEGVEKMNSISPSHRKNCFLFHVKAVETKIKTQ